MDDPLVALADFVVFAFLELPFLPFAFAPPFPRREGPASLLPLLLLEALLEALRLGRGMLGSLAIGTIAEATEKS